MKYSLWLTGTCQWLLQNPDIFSGQINFRSIADAFVSFVDLFVDHVFLGRLSSEFRSVCDFRDNNFPDDDIRFVDLFSRFFDDSCFRWAAKKTKLVLHRHKSSVVLSSRIVSVVALIVIIFIFVVMMIFSGFLIDVKSIFTSLQWIRWFSAFRYSTNLLSINEFQGLVFCRSNETNHCFLTGEQVLTQQDIPHQTDWHFWSNYLALLLMILVSLLLSYIQLVRMKKTKWIREESTDSHRDCLSSQFRSISINLLVHRVRLNSVQRRITQQERLLGQCRSVLV